MPWKRATKANRNTIEYEMSVVIHLFALLFTLGQLDDGCRTRCPGSERYSNAAYVLCATIACHQHSQPPVHFALPSYLLVRASARAFYTSYVQFFVLSRLSLSFRYSISPLSARDSTVKKRFWTEQKKSTPEHTTRHISEEDPPSRRNSATKKRRRAAQNKKPRKIAR